MSQDTLYKGLFQKQLLLAIPVKSAVLSMLFTAFVANLTTDVRFALIFPVAWLFFFTINRGDKHIINIVFTYLAVFGVNQKDTLIKAVVHD